MVRVTLICVGKLKEDYLTGACREYEKRLGAFCQLRTLELPSAKLPENASARQIAAALETEGARILGAIPEGSRVYALCVEGAQYDSETLSAEWAGKGNLCCIIGSSHGLAEAVKRRADCKLSLSQLTFPHQLTRVLLLEQLYRSFMIARGGKYHK